VINLKLRQINNISYHLEKACEQKKKHKKYVCETEESYSLPVVEETIIVGPKR
jgi:hypothetical protein